MKENSFLWYRVNLRVSQTMLNHNQNLFLIVSYCFCLFGEFAKVLEWLICILQRVHFQIRVGVFNCQQIFTKISFVFFFCAEMLRQLFHRRQKATSETTCEFLLHSEILHSENKIDKEC